MASTRAICGRSMLTDDEGDPSDLAELAVGLVANTFYRRRHLALVIVPHSEGVGYCTTQMQGVAPEELLQMLDVIDELRAHMLDTLRGHDPNAMPEMPYGRE